jgi:hypothetical protein
MATFLLSFALIALAIGGLALGVIFGRAPIRGSCGGLACDGACTGCDKERP